MKIDKCLIFLSGKDVEARTRREAFEITTELGSILNDYIGRHNLNKSEFIRDAIARKLEQMPAEPLIKDEKIRKAVRAWAEANGLNNVAFEDYDNENCYFIDRDYEPQIWFPRNSILDNRLDDGKIYSIAELCGEEEEYVEVATREYDHAEAISRATENLCGEEEE